MFYLLFATFSVLTSRFALPSEKSLQTDVVLFTVTEYEGMIGRFVYFRADHEDFTNTLLIHELCTHK